jgi:hypothetical protein
MRCNWSAIDCAYKAALPFVIEREHVAFQWGNTALCSCFILIAHPKLRAMFSPTGNSSGTIMGIGANK